MFPSRPLFFILFFSYCVYLLFLTSEAKAMDDGRNNDTERRVSIGAIVDYSSYVGKEEKVAMKMAIDDFYKNRSHKLVLHVRDSGRQPMQAALAAMDLINKKQVRAILGVPEWHETALAAEIGDKAQVPILSLAEIAPPWATKSWPFLVQATHNQLAQMRAIAAMIGTWQWQQVNFIYEDVNSVSTSIVPLLVDALKEVDCEVDYMLPLPPLASSLSKELEKLKSRQCRVHIVHTSLQLAIHLFIEANKMGMIAKESVWITTDSITGLLDYVNASVISSMQGILGVRSYFPQTGSRYKDFYTKFPTRFFLEHPKEVASSEPGIFGVQAYDAVWAVALALERRTNGKTEQGQMDFEGSFHGKRLLDEILRSSFEGLTGDFRFIEGELAPAQIFRVINVVGKSYRDLGLWSEGSGFSLSINEGFTNYNKSMKILGQVFWPGGPWSVPRGWVCEKPLRIGVPKNSSFKQFVNVRYDSGGRVIAEGFSIEVFNAVVELLPFPLPHVFVPYEGTYDSLVEQIHLKKMDAVVGDTSIVASRCKYAEFSQPWSDSGLQMVVLKRSIRSSDKAWLFMKPFTTGMWASTAGINIYNGFVVWLIERAHNPDFKGTPWNQLGTLIWLAFSTLFSLHADRLHSNLSRITMLVWLFVALVITQSYTANLSSLLTVSKIQSDAISVDTIKKANAKVGCDDGSFVIKYLEDVLGFEPQNIKPFTSYDDYPEALRRGEIVAAFLEVPFVKVFLAKYCKDFEAERQIYKVGGFGFVFPRGSPMLPDVSEAILEVTESGKLLELENAMIYSFNCSSSESDDDHGSLGVTSYGGLLLITGGTSTIALLVYSLHLALRRRSSEVDIDLHDPYEDELCMFAPEMEAMDRLKGIINPIESETPI